MSEHLNIDLHTHSSCSDGSLAPADLVDGAAAAQIEVLALTDHDTVAGLAAAARRAAELGVRLVAGVEISASWRAQAIHVLGLWIDPDSPALRAALDAQAAHRALRMRKICRRLSEVGLPGERLLAAVEANPGLPTRAHLAAAMVAEGIVARTNDAFKRSLARGRAAHIAADWPAARSKGSPAATRRITSRPERNWRCNSSWRGRSARISTIQKFLGIPWVG